jgi:hypothetical protein
MILLTNGCSWTWGGALEPWWTTDDQREKLVWPHHLGSQIGADKVVNLAEGCGSNDRIWRTTFNYILSQPRNELQDTLAIIQFTDLSRYEIYCPVTNYIYENIEHRWARCKADVVLCPSELYKNLSSYNQLRLQYTSEIESIYKFISQCTSLHSIFTEHNVKYYFWSAMLNIFQYPDVFKNYLLKFNWLSGHNIWDYERVSPSDSHPSLNGHNQIARIMFDQIKDNLDK